MRAMISTLPTELLHAYRYLEKTKVNRVFFLLLGSLSAIVAFLNLCWVMCLFPLVKGLINQNFEGVRSRALVKKLTMAFPHLFSHPASLFVLIVLLVYALIVVKNALAYGASLLVRREALFSARHMRITLLDRYLGFGKLFFDQNVISSLVWPVTNCNRWIETTFVAFHMFLSGLLEVTVYFCIMCAISWRLATAVVVAAPLFQLVGRVLRQIRSTAVQYENSVTSIHERLTQLLSSLMLVRTSGQTAQERARFIELCSEEIPIAMRFHRRASLMDPIQEISGITAVMFVALCLSLFLTTASVNSAGLFVFFFLVIRSVAVLNGMGKSRAILARDMALAQSLESLMSDEKKHAVPTGQRVFTGEFNKIELRDLDFSYPLKPQVLSKMNLTIHNGQSLGLVGPTGAGKTTVAHLLMRFYDCPAGSIFIDGVDIREFETDSLRRHMAFVGQDTPVINDTIRANILYAAPTTPTEQQLQSAIDKARLGAFIAGLPQKLETWVGERGVLLSAGERQRIAIARALLKNAPILILDEPTSALDPENERSITEAMEETMRGRTTLVIAHRLSTIQRLDRIVVLDHGKIVQEGRYDQLRLQPGYFQVFPAA
jgi:subfamily B ATP-binding cassette protein MsbA